jgi:proteasome alpha subunit
MPFGYVSPEQLMKDRADYARKGIARGRSVVVLAYDDGILFVGENLSRALHKISEIYDRIAFAAVGKYNEFENLRIAGVRLADLRGYSYDRRDVTGRGLANAYAQTLGTIFTQESKPYEVEIVVAEVGETPAEDQMYRLTYDGSVADEHGFVVMGGQAESISTALGERWTPGLSLTDALALAVELLGADAAGGEQRQLTANQLEVAMLERRRPRRKFRRLTGAALSDLLGQVAEPGDAPTEGPRPDEREVSPPTSLAGGAHEPSGPEPTPDA